MQVRSLARVFFERTTRGPAGPHPWQSLVAVGGVVYFAVVVLVLHALSPEFNPIRHPLSYFVRGAYGGLMVSAFLAIGVAVLAIALGLRRAITPSRSSRTVVGLLVFAAAAIAVAGVFPTDIRPFPDSPRTLIGRVHFFATLTAFTAFVAAALLFARLTIQHPGWQHYRRSARFLASVVLLTFVIVLVVYELPVRSFGIAQRVFVPANLVWITATALHLRHTWETPDPAATTRSSTAESL